MQLFASNSKIGISKNLLAETSRKEVKRVTNKCWAISALSNLSFIECPISEEGRIEIADFYLMPWLNVGQEISSCFNLSHINFFGN